MKYFSYTFLVALFLFTTPLLGQTNGNLEARISRIENGLMSNLQIKGEFLHSYLNKFCHKLNRRYFGKKVFYRLVVASIMSYLLWSD